jgi:hypothetical protein
VNRIVHRVLAAAVLLGLSACGDAQAKPYDDKESTGLIGLFDHDGHQVTSGKIGDRPFVSYAVSDQKAPAGYDKPGRKAALLAFVPRDGVDPAKWGGDFLTGSTTYTDVAHPIAHGTDEDISLAEFMKTFPPQADGRIQLRIYLGAPSMPGKIDQYVTADLKVSGDTWTVTRGAANLPAPPTTGASG